MAAAAEAEVRGSQAERARKEADVRCVVPSSGRRIVDATFTIGTGM